MKNRYGFGKSVSYSFDEAIDRVTKALQAEGFGVLTEIDVKATLKKKLDVDMPPYRILGACNPGFAHKAIGAEASMGLLLPCNVVVREDAASQVHVEFMDPIARIALVDNPGAAEIAKEVREKLDRVCASV